MIRAIIAIDSKRGMSDDSGMPWNLPNEHQFFVDSIQTGKVLMGYCTYVETDRPLGGGDNYVATSKTDKLRDGFVPVRDACEFLKAADDDVWNIGGPGLLKATLHLIDEFYVTQIESDFGCTKFAPDFDNLFSLEQESDPVTEDGVTYRFQVWRPMKERFVKL
ncbi:MAG: dihydrofolate reductase [Candidatus Saccharimonas sp.]